MSETVHFRGVLKEVAPKEGQTTEDLARQIIEEDKFDKESYHDTFLECLEDEGYKKYVIHGERIFKLVENEETDPNDGIFEAKKEPDGTISFEVRYYNGGCGFGEAIGYALEKLD